MTEDKINLDDFRKPKSKKEEGSTSLNWGKDGDGSAVFSGAQEIPTDTDIRALLERVGKDQLEFGQLASHGRGSGTVGKAQRLHRALVCSKDQDRTQGQCR